MASASTPHLARSTIDHRTLINFDGDKVKLGHVLRSSDDRALTTLINPPEFELLFNQARWIINL